MGPWPALDDESEPDREIQGHLERGAAPRWTSENRPSIDTSKPAAASGVRDGS